MAAPPPSSVSSKVHQALQEVFAGKAWHQPMLVLVYAAVEVVGDADVQSPRAIGHDIDVIACQTLPPAGTIAARRSLTRAAPTPPRFVRDDSQRHSSTANVETPGVESRS